MLLLQPSYINQHLLILHPLHLRAHPVAIGIAPSA